METDSRDTIARALLKAADLIGGVTELHLYLRVDRSQLFGWIVGKGVPPEDTFLRVVDLLIDPQAAQNARVDHGGLGDEVGVSSEKPPR